ncbi:MAG: DUF3025 domain-containing protein [Gallionella sp.]
MSQIHEWNSAALLRSPLFAPLHPVLAELGTDDFPALHECNAMLAARASPVTVQSGMALRFVPQQSGKLPFEEQYEPRCYLRGDVPTRAYNWHDLFNALVWLTFPKTKAVLNARHYAALIEERASGHTRRGAVRDVNTLFDESGVIIAYADANTSAGLAALLKDFQWQELFWQRREQVKENMGFYLFGHGLYEKALQPYVGMTGQGLLLAVEPAFFSWPQVQQLKHLDSLLSDYLAVPEHCCSTRELSPVPVLGVPGWVADNDSAAYYENTAYFRPGRRG